MSFSKLQLVLDDCIGEGASAFCFDDPSDGATVFVYTPDSKCCIELSSFSDDGHAISAEDMCMLMRLVVMGFESIYHRTKPVDKLHELPSVNDAEYAELEYRVHIRGRAAGGPWVTMRNGEHDQALYSKMVKHGMADEQPTKWGLARKKYVINQTGVDAIRQDPRWGKLP